MGVSMSRQKQGSRTRFWRALCFPKSADSIVIVRPKAVKATRKRRTARALTALGRSRKTSYRVKVLPKNKDADLLAGYLDATYAPQNRSALCVQHSLHQSASQTNHPETYAISLIIETVIFCW